MIDWWFAECGPWAVAVKSSNTYARNIDYADVPADAVEGAFRKRVEAESLSLGEVKALEDHLFWYSVRRATAMRLAVKLHTGYYAQWAGKKDRMPLSKVPTFGGDYIPVEPVVGHARIAREGISLALAELVDEGWLSLDDALSLVEPLLNRNARDLFDVDEKERKLASAPWV